MILSIVNNFILKLPYYVKKKSLVLNNKNYMLRTLKDRPTSWKIISKKLMKARLYPTNNTMTMLKLSRSPSCNYTPAFWLTLKDTTSTSSTDCAAEFTARMESQQKYSHVKENQVWLEKDLTQGPAHCEIFFFSREEILYLKNIANTWTYINGRRIIDKKMSPLSDNDARIRCSNRRWRR